VLGEEDDPGGDRQRVRQERREADGGQRPPALEAELQAREGEPVRGEERRHEDELPTGDGLRRDVSRRVEEPRCRAERGTGAKAGRAPRRDGRACEPESDTEARAVAPVRRPAQRDREQPEPGDRDADAPALGGREPLGDEQREHADPAGRRRLHE